MLISAFIFGLSIVVTLMSRWQGLQQPMDSVIAVAVFDIRLGLCESVADVVERVRVRVYDSALCEQIREPSCCIVAIRGRYIVGIGELCAPAEAVVLIRECLSAAVYDGRKPAGIVVIITENRAVRVGGFSFVAECIILVTVLSFVSVTLVTLPSLS